MRHHFTSALLLIILISVTIFGCQQQETSTSNRVPKGKVSLGGELRTPIAELMKTYEPASMAGRSSNAVGVHLHEGLVRLHPETSELVPGLAESWSVEEGGNAYVFNLRKRALFHHSDWFSSRSREATSKDVVYSFKVLAREASQELFSATLKGRVVGAEDYRGGENELSGVEVLDDYTIRIKLEKADQSFLQILTAPAFGVIPDGSAEDNQIGSIGAGPFMMAAGESGLTLVRNPDYFGQDEFENNFPYLDTLVFIELTQNTERLDAFFNGQIDIVPNLELDPIREVLERHVPEFSGKAPKYVLKRESDIASYDTYSIFDSRVKNLGSGFMGYRDFSRVQIEQ